MAVLIVRIVSLILRFIVLYIFSVNMLLYCSSLHRTNTLHHNSRLNLLRLYESTSLSVSSKKRVLSGVQPTGSLHLGNYLGAIRQWVQYQEQYSNYFCVVDLHAITVPHDPKRLRAETLQSAAMYLACGIDPKESKIFIQSHVRAHTELAWLLNCITPMNWLERMIQFKDKAKKQGNYLNICNLFRC